MTFPPSPYKTKHEQGFSLVEAAIVLGVVGLVIGAIWVAAATVRANMKQNQAVSGYIDLYHQIKDMFPPQITYALGADYAVPAPSTATLRIPAGFTSSSFVPVDPYGESVSFYINSTMWSTEQNVITFSIGNNADAAGLLSTDQSKCLKFIPALTAALGTSGPLRRVVFCDTVGCTNRVSVARSSFPIPPTTTLCERARIILGFEP